MSTTYHVYRTGVQVKQTVSEKTFTDTGLTPHTTYQYQVSAQNEAGESPKSEPISVTTAYSAVASVALDKETLSITMGQTATLVAKVQPATADPNVTWASSDASSVTVNGSGKVTPVKVGTAILTISSKADSTKQATCTVTVTEAPPPSQG
ncbi:Ig-like domain-containing protein [Rhodococcus erythropolis]|uniref:Ig-like domain-containing protein n=1 Tax=Rhodococcus erythropolis TaxID=1833 RepID=UPI001885208F|nr:Ig-like domain-containing protein [Rhodococcus erythropolis]